MPAPPIRVRQIDHVTVVVKDLDASRRFYRDVLGMEQVARPAFTFEGLWFQAGSTQVHLILEHAESGPVPPPSSGSSRSRHFAFEVDDIVATQQRLEELRVPIVAGPKNRPDGPVQLYIRDPDGNLVELFR